MKINKYIFLINTLLDSERNKKCRYSFNEYNDKYYYYCYSLNSMILNSKSSPKVLFSSIN